MQPDPGHVVIALYMLAAAIGLPSALGLVAAAVLALKTGGRPPSGTLAMPSPNPDAILLMLAGITRAAGALAWLVGLLGKFLAVVLALASAAGLVVAIGTYLTAQGLAGQEPWARDAAMAILGLALALSMLAALALRRSWRVVLPLATGAGSVYALAALSAHAVS